MLLFLDVVRDFPTCNYPSNCIYGKSSYILAAVWISWWSAGLVVDGCKALVWLPTRWHVVSLGKTLNAVSHHGTKQSTCCGGPAW